MYEYDKNTSIFGVGFRDKRIVECLGISQKAKKEMGNRLVVYRHFCLWLCDYLADRYIINSDLT